MRSVLTAVIACAALAGCSQSGTSVSGTSINGSQTTAALAASVDVLKICSGFGCVIDNKVTFGPDDLQSVRTMMKSGIASAEAERAAVAVVIGRMETLSRAKGRYMRDTPKAWPRDSGKRGQMDCVDESLNTSAYLRYLHRHGLLRFHTPDRGYAERGLIIDGRYPHKSATMTDKSGTRWAVDSWYGTTGDVAQIMPHAKWRQVRN